MNINVKQSALFLGVAFLILGSINATIKNVSGGTVCFAAGIIVILLFHFDVKKFNVFGLAAELREKIDEADKILSQLRGIALPVSELAIVFASKTARRQGEISRRSLFQYVHDIESELIELGVEADEIEKVKKGWCFITLTEMVGVIFRGIIDKAEKKDRGYVKAHDEFHKAKQGNSDECKAVVAKHNVALEEISKIYAELATIDSIIDLMDVRELRELSLRLKDILMGISTLDEEEKKEVEMNLKDAWEDLDYFITEKKLRRPEVWFKE